MSDPVGRRMFGHRDTHNPTPIMRKDHENEEHSEEDGRHNEKARGNQVLRVILEEWAASDDGPCTSRPSIRKVRNPASRVLREFSVLPKEDSPCSSCGSDGSSLLTRRVGL